MTSADAATPDIATLPGLSRTGLTSPWSNLTVWTPPTVTGRDVFIYPSLGRVGADFDVLVAALYADGHRVLTLDPLTIDSSATSGVGLEGLVSDALSLLSRAGAEEFHAIGHAFGSRVVREMSISYASRVKTVACLACGGSVPATAAAATALPRCYDYSLSDNQRTEALGTAFFAPQHDPSVWLDGWYPNTAKGERAAGISNTTFFNGGSQPMLIIQGSHDTIAPPANARQLKEARTEQTTLITVYAGHALVPEQPALIIRELRAFINSNGA